MSRSKLSRPPHNLTRTIGAAFDFDVVTDVPARPSRKPDQTAAAAPPEAGPLREKPATAEA